MEGKERERENSDGTGDKEVEKGGEVNVCMKG